MRLSRLTAVTAAGVAIVIVMAACSSSKEPSGGGNTGGSSTGSGGTTSAASPPPSGLPDPAQQPKSKVQAASLTGDCAPFSKYGKYSGATVTMYASITNPEGASLEKSWKKFEQCTGITIQYTGDKEFETALKAKVEGGNAPDIAIIPQPGLVQTFATSGKLKPASDAVTREAEGNWNKDWIGYATVDDLYFGSPMSGNAKSLVWYSPKYFEQYGYTVPTTWDDMVTLSDKMAADGHKPWCAGIESGTATGWPATDWLEEVVLRKYGPDVYDQWIAHQIPFNDPKILDSLKTVGSIWKNPKYVNAGIGGVKSIATTAFQKGGLPIEKGKCMMHQQANFYGANWDKGYTIGPNGDIYAFYEPPMSDKFGKPVEGGGEFVTAFSDRPEVEATQLYIASPEWATSRIKVATGWVSANQKVDPSTYTDPIDKLSAQLLADPQATFRFDASDAMPSTVGAGTEWTQLTQWILGQSDKDTLDKIESSWPK